MNTVLPFPPSGTFTPTQALESAMADELETDAKASEQNLKSQ